jgi:ATP-dependent protease HslVU (ClpYQ) ATPase subunit
VKKAWEGFILGYLLGKNFEKSRVCNAYKERLHEGDLDNAEIQIWFGEKDKVEHFKISEIKNNFYRECFDKLSMNIDFDEILKKNIEERAIICIDEFDKLIKDVLFLYINFIIENSYYKLESKR